MAAGAMERSSFVVTGDTVEVKESILHKEWCNKLLTHDHLNQARFSVLLSNPLTNVDFPFFLGCSWLAWSFLFALGF